MRVSDVLPGRSGRSFNDPRHAGLNDGLVARHGHAERAAVRFRHAGDSMPRLAEIGLLRRALGKPGR